MTTRLIDVSGQHMNPVSLSPRQLTGSITRTLAAARQIQAGQRAQHPMSRHDGMGPQVQAQFGLSDEDPVESWAVEEVQRRNDAAILQRFYKDGGRFDSSAIAAHRTYETWKRDTLREQGIRLDSAGLSPGIGAFPRELEFIRSEPWREIKRPLNGDVLFPKDRSVPLGARKHTARRIVGGGEAKTYRGGTDFGRAKTTRKEEQFGVRYYTCAVEVDWFTTLSLDWAGIREHQNDLEEADRLLDERRNRTIFNGDRGDVYGILSYPHMGTQDWPQTITPSTDPKDFVSNLHAVADTPIIVSGGKFQPTAMATGLKLQRWMRQTQHSDASDTMLWDFFRAGQDPLNGIQSLRGIQEFDGAGPNGEDYILFYRPEQRAVADVEIQGNTTMPAHQSNPVHQIIVKWCAHGGIVAMDVGHMLLVKIDTSGLR